MPMAQQLESCVEQTEKLVPGEDEKQELEPGAGQPDGPSRVELVEEHIENQKPKAQ